MSSTPAAAAAVHRDDALRLRFHQHRFASAEQGTSVPSGDGAQLPLLDIGVQDTGGAAAAQWALALRGHTVDDADLVYTWTLRGAPHAYRRGDIAEVAAATAPYDEADAGKRIFDAATPLRKAGIPILDALAVVAQLEQQIVTAPMVKGEVSGALTRRVPDPYLRECRACQATHVYEQPFRLAALPAGLELEPGTSPPVLRPIDGWSGPAATAPDRLDPIRAYLHLFGPATPHHVAGYLDAPVRTIRRHWPEDAVAVDVDDEPRFLLASDLDLLHEAEVDDEVRLLGPFDPWLQARDRDLLVPDRQRHRQLWPVLGRPGAILEGMEIVGTWRPRTKGSSLQLQVEQWELGAGRLAAIDAAAARLAAHRGKRYAGVVAG